MPAINQIFKMKTSRIYFSLIAFLILPLPFKGYSQQNIKELKVGDKIPNIELDSAISSKKISIKNLYTNKLLIINFWATWCVPCVAELRLLDSLKTKYSQSLNVLSVTDDHLKLVKDFLTKHTEIEPDKLFITSDSKKLIRYFPHRSIPHNIWVDSTGTIIAITDNVDLNERNVKQYLAGKMPQVMIKHDKQNFSWLKPLHVEDSLLTYRSIITRYNPELNSGVVSNHFYSKRMLAWNIPLVDLFWLAYTKQLSGITNWNMIEIHTNDSLKFYNPKAVPVSFKKSNYYDSNKTYKEQYRLFSFDHDYCYELLLPESVDNESFSRFVFQDLERFFHTQATIENRNVNCRIVQLTKSSVLKNAHRSTEKPVFQRLSDRIITKNVKLDDFLLCLNDEFNKTGLPFINNTGIDYGLDLIVDLPKEKITIEQILKQLSEKYGLNFEKVAFHEYPILVLRDN